MFSVNRQGVEEVLERECCFAPKMNHGWLIKARLLSGAYLGF